VANEHEALRGKADFAGEFDLLIQQQQGVPPITVDVTEPDESDILLEEFNSIRLEQKQIQKDADWKAFDEARIIDAAEARRLGELLDRGDAAVPAADVWALKKFRFCDAYGLSAAVSITRATFESDSKAKRARLRAHEAALLVPRVEDLLEQRDYERLVAVQERQCTPTEWKLLQGVIRHVEEQVLYIFGFPPNVTVGKCLYHDKLMCVSDSYCERNLVLMQLQSLRVTGLPKLKGATDPIKWLRSFLKTHWGVGLTKLDPRKKKTEGVPTLYAVHPERMREVVQRRNPNLLPPTMQQSFPYLPLAVAAMPLWHTLVSFMLCFSPRFLPVLCMQPIRVVGVPVASNGPPCRLVDYVVEKPPLVVFKQGSVLLYAMNGQYWVIWISSDGTHWCREQMASANQIVDKVVKELRVNPLVVGQVWLAVNPFPTPFVFEEAGVQITPKSWAQRFIKVLSN
jgi:hypothetical protein